MATPDVDVVIPTRNRQVELATTLAGLAAQTYQHFRVLVSDQSDGEPSYATQPAQTMARVLRLRGQDVTFTRHLPRRGLAEHRQFLLDQATAPHVLFLDDDVWLEPAALGRLRTAIGELGCGFVGAAPHGLSYVDDGQPHQLTSYEEWDGPVVPERITRDSPEFWRATVNSAANPYHLERRLGARTRRVAGLQDRVDRWVRPLRPGRARRRRRFRLLGRTAGRARRRGRRGAVADHGAPRRRGHRPERRGPPRVTHHRARPPGRGDRSGP
jgi:glycosyltransferase involved in cell wall biosynthesis